MIIRVLAFLIIIFIAIIYHFTNIIDFFNKGETSANILEILAKRSVYYEMNYILFVQSILLNRTDYLVDDASQLYKYGYYRDVLLTKETSLENYAETMKDSVPISYALYMDSNTEFCQIMDQISASVNGCMSDYGKLYEQGMKNLLFRYIFLSDAYKDKIIYALNMGVAMDKLRYDKDYMGI